MAELTMVDLDQVIPSLDAIHGLVDRDPAGAKAWLRDLMLMLRYPVQGEGMPGVDLDELGDAERASLVRDDPLRMHPGLASSSALPFDPTARRKSKSKPKAKPVVPPPAPPRTDDQPGGRDLWKIKVPFAGPHQGRTLWQVVRSGDRNYLERLDLAPWLPVWFRGDLRRFLAACEGNGRNAVLLASINARPPDPS